MPFYQGINSKTREGRRTAQNLRILKKALREQIPVKTVDDRLLLATWNIRDFDKPTFGERSDEAIYYIAEIVSKFDIVAVQEVYEDLKGLKRLIKVLGGYWKYLTTDVTVGDRGNHERMTFLYDSRKISFGGVAGEAVLPPIEVVEDGKKKKVNAEQFWRTPFLCGFKAGWSRFMLASVHILWGASQATPANRVEEIEKVAKFFRELTERKTTWSQNVILLGDFNIFDVGDDTFKRLTDEGFIVPETLTEFTSNAKQNRQYDQIAFKIQDERLNWTEKSGVFKFFDYVYRDEDEQTYVKAMGEAYTTTSKGTPRADPSQYYKTFWRTHEMSDHYPMWVELVIDFSDEYLERKLEGEIEFDPDLA